MSDGSWQAEEKEKKRKIMSEQRGERRIGAGKGCVKWDRFVCVCAGVTRGQSECIFRPVKNNQCESSLVSAFRSLQICIPPKYSKMSAECH